jgi:hypothetical protein
MIIVLEIISVPIQAPANANPKFDTSIVSPLTREFEAAARFKRRDG